MRENKHQRWLIQTNRAITCATWPHTSYTDVCSNLHINQQPTGNANAICIQNKPRHSVDMSHPIGTSHGPVCHVSDVIIRIQLSVSVLNVFSTHVYRPTQQTCKQTLGALMRIAIGKQMLLMSANGYQQYNWRCLCPCNDVIGSICCQLQI